MMGMLNKPVKFGVKNIKEIPTNRGLQFQKNKPMTKYNYPLTGRTTYQIYGYKISKHSGIKRPAWIKASQATGKPLTPQRVGLDGFYDVKVLHQSGVVAPRREKKDIKYSKIDGEEDDTFIYNKNVINNRGYLNTND